MNTRLVPSRQVEPLWESFHGLPAAGHPMRAAVVIEPADQCSLTDGDYYCVTSGQPLRIAE